MKTYYNGPRKGMMYGGGANLRKPMMYGGMASKKKDMQMGGLAEQNKKPNQSDMMSTKGNMMTSEKKFNMGMMYGGKAKKNKMLYGGQAKLDMNKNNKIDKEDFKIMKKK